MGPATRHCFKHRRPRRTCLVRAFRGPSSSGRQLQLQLPITIATIISIILILSEVKRRAVLSSASDQATPQCSANQCLVNGAQQCASGFQWTCKRSSKLVHNSRSVV
ncbi:nitrogenase molybdenum-iron protein, alpha and beta chain [Anopheles sinensis]|uniref:Nitrogenase molybdenum-iron protein, alpha and beta chain n=1 Tax=Anopheles sinensis TaxID=74873 RepID=A0A084VVL6_ANOSI|nr:nitrogenase molybdenum-iron protein, alpha and beta chain [Anopheles sinensis]